MPSQSSDIAPVDGDWVCGTDADWRLSHPSQADDPILRPVESFTRPDRTPRPADGVDPPSQPDDEANAEGRSVLDVVHRSGLPDGDIQCVRIAGGPHLSVGGPLVDSRGVASDASSDGGLRGILADALADLHASHARIVEQNRRFDAALRNMTQGLCMFDAQACLVVVNPRYCEIFGIPLEHLRVGMDQREICELLVARGCYPRGTTVESLCDSTRRALLDHDPLPIHRELADGRTLSISYRPIEGGGWVATFEDITERRRNEARIAYMARHDALTDLPNRTFLRERGVEMLSRAVSRQGRRGAERLAMLCLDLDRFKAVNDTHGHGGGDVLLRAVADRLRANVRAGDLVARLGGDEFAVLLRVTDTAGAAAMAERLIENVSRPYNLSGCCVEIGMSVGIAMAEAGDSEIEPLLKNADTALYHAKGTGRGVACTFETAMDENVLARRALEADLAEAVQDGAFELHYQPLVDLDGDRVTGLEALIRWKHPVRGAISPATFIPVAEETGMIVAIGEWVLRRACADAAAWPGDIRVAVNVSAVQLRRRDFAQIVLMALAASGLPPTRLELEITEGVLLEETDANLETLHVLRRAGIRICMDDFGTGYSSLSYLRRFPFDKIKIDRSFIQDAGRTSEAAAIIRALVGLGASLGIATLAEGVETPEQLAAVRAEGCQAIQGFLFSPPRPAPEIVELLTGAARQAAA